MQEPSFWLERIGPRPVRRALSGDLDVDVCVLGAGYTGLWTAYYLAKADPSLRVAVVEGESVGFGASGRNGGWASAKIAGIDRLLADPATRPGAAATYREMIATLDEIGSVVGSERIDCGYTLGGSVVAATRPSHVGRLKEEVVAEHAGGFGEDDLRWMEPDEARRVIAPSRLHGATFTPHCAALDPAALAVGLAAAAERAGVTIYEDTPGTPVLGGVLTPGGRVRAGVVVEGLEAYRTSLPGRRRDVIPVYSLMVVTEALPAETWQTIGLAHRETFSDGRHLIIYGQRTGDGRIAFGGRGAPYHFGSAVRPQFDRDEPTFAFLRETLVDLFPAIRGVHFDGAWGGPLAIPRDWQPSIRFDGSIAVVGGYVGQGVALANLAGRTVRDLILRRDTDITRLPWVGHRSRRWEPEPLRWVGVNLARRLTESVDRAEESGRRPRIRQAVFDRLPVG
ncbi:MAG: FAD-dependent oxidoreductase [Actinobacteria bacterium RBG_16_68_21]|nr:MAG: FAD-dependent oxidoreductase [Actinobacteria bacterium RBG_16_68_21]